MKLDRIPHPVLAKLFALQQHAEQVADLKTRMPEITARLRRTINDESQIGNSRDEVTRNRKAAEAELQALCAFWERPANQHLSPRRCCVACIFLVQILARRAA